METRSGTDRGASYDPSAKTPPEKASIVEDFIDIFYAPSSVFARRALSGFWVQFLIITVVAALFAFANRGVFEQIYEAEFSRGIARAASDPRITPEVIAMQKNIGGKIAGVISYAATPMVVFFGALILWGAARAFGAKVSYGQSALIMTLSQIPRLLGAVLTTVQMLLTDTTSLSSFHQLTYSPARFLDPDTTNRMLMGFLARLDLFTLWATVLIAIGVAVIGKVPKARAAMAAAVVWLVATLFQMFGQGGGG